MERKTILGTVLLWILLIAVGFYSFLVSRKAKVALRKADHMSDRLYSWGSETRTMMEELNKRIRRLDFEMSRRAGEIKLSPEMRISDILAVHPRMKEVLAGVHLGGCSSCATSESETLAAGAASYGLDIQLILGEIDRFLADPDHYTAMETPQLQPQSGSPIQIHLPDRPGEG